MIYIPIKPDICEDCGNFKRGNWLQKDVCKVDDVRCVVKRDTNGLQNKLKCGDFKERKRKVKSE